MNAVVNEILLDASLKDINMCNEAPAWTEEQVQDSLGRGAEGNYPCVNEQNYL
jgi:hypothetical protein